MWYNCIRKEGDSKMFHKLKIKKQHLVRLITGDKKAEVRKDDRGYQTGDVLKYYSTSQRGFIYFRITYVNSGYGCLEGFKVLSVERIKDLWNLKKMGD